MQAVQGTEDRGTAVGNWPPPGGTLAETFVLRLWEPSEAAGREPGALRGIVRHARSGRTATFADGESLLELLRAERSAPERSSGGAP